MIRKWVKSLYLLQRRPLLSPIAIVGAWKLTVVVWSYTLLTFMMRAWCMIFFYVMHPSPTIIFWWKNLELIQSQTLTYKWQNLFKHKKVLYLNNFIKAISQNIKIVLKVMLWEGSKLRIDQWNAFLWQTVRLSNKISCYRKKHNL